MNIPAIQGKPISIVTSNENDILFCAVCKSPLDLHAVTVGTSAVANAMLKDNGRVVNVSTLPLNIPYCLNASLSVKKFSNFLFTVLESIFLFTDASIELKNIGIDTNKMFLTVLKMLFVP